MAEVLLVERVDKVAILTMNRPESLNSLNTELKVALRDALTEVGADTSVSAVILTGAGRGFCVGQDLSEHLETLEAGNTSLNTVAEHYNPIVEAIAGMGKPVIAAVNGVAAGAGAAFAFACDFRIVSETAQFVLAFANAGLGLDSGASWTLPRLIGTAKAVELAMLAEPINAKVADSYGLVTQLVAIGEVLSVSQKLAERIASGPSGSYAAIKDAIQFAATHTLSESLAHEGEWQAKVGATEDHRIAVSAFVKKEKPVFVGHPFERKWM
jgi:2-(1,2-epoxy-1,2-dihydrophenyl)acetyl-CoA isomerase